jgi:hypothetical protein
MEKNLRNLPRLPKGIRPRQIFLVVDLSSGILLRPGPVMRYITKKKKIFFFLGNLEIIGSDG